MLMLAADVTLFSILIFTLLPLLLMPLASRFSDYAAPAPHTPPPAYLRHTLNIVYYAIYAARYMLRCHATPATAHAAELLPMPSCRWRYAITYSAPAEMPPCHAMLTPAPAMLRYATMSAFTPPLLPYTVES